MNRYRWASPGDVNAFFGLMLDNIADLVLMVSLLVTFYKFPAEIALTHMVPGTAIGVFVGDLAFFLMAFRLARRTGRNDITAMPLGLDTPSTFGMVFFVLGPSFEAAKAAGSQPQAAAIFAWHVGICAILISGVFKIACAIACNWVRRVVPRAGLLGSLAGIALVLISFLPLVELLRVPVVGLVALAIVLTSLVARLPLPGKVPGTLGALIAGSAIFYFMHWAGWLGVSQHNPSFDPHTALLPGGWLDAFRFQWIGAFRASLDYLPIVIPFALATVVGGIDCTESAAAAGDDYDTRQIIAVEGAATLVAGLCGGVIQSTPYIGHPAYKQMGGRAAYTLATALFVGTAGVFGYFGYIYAYLPKPALLPILIFIGLEIASQSFRATPRRHFPAVALACVPAMAALVMIYVDRMLPLANFSLDTLAEKLNAGEPLARELQTMRTLSSGFLVTSLLWASWLAALIDHRQWLAAAYASIAAVCSLFGVIHSPLASSALFVPWNLPTDLPRAAAGQTPLYFASAYAIVALLLVAWGIWCRRQGYRPRSVEEDVESG